MSPNEFSKAVLDWFDHHGRHHLPWQKNTTPYRVWVSEIMLQQTQVTTVIPYYQQFIKAFPNLRSLAQAPIDNVLHLWTGLGYYSRARHLHQTAQIISTAHHGRFPRSVEQLMALPGIGRSTAGAITSIAMQQPSPILDGNVKRVLTRYFAIEGWPGHTSIQKTLWKKSAELTPSKRTNHYNQAMMDLGATVCKRSQPQCAICPLHTHCQAHLSQRQHLFPNKKPKTGPRRQRTTFFHLICDSKQQLIFLEKRPDTGIWGGLWSLPESQSDNMPDHLFNNTPYTLIKNVPLETFTHQFSHYDLIVKPIITFITIKTKKSVPTNAYVWYDIHHSPPGGLPAPIKHLLELMKTRYLS